MMKLLICLFVCSAAFSGSWSRSIANIDVVQVTEANFDQVVNSKKPVILDINASWCSACKMMNPIMDELSEEFSGSVIFAKVDVDTQHEISKRYDVTALPTIVFLKPGQKTPFMKVVGSISKDEFREKVNQLLAK